MRGLKWLDNKITDTIFFVVLTGTGPDRILCKSPLFMEFEEGTLSPVYRYTEMTCECIGTPDMVDMFVGDEYAADQVRITACSAKTG